MEVRRRIEALPLMLLLLSQINIPIASSEDFNCDPQYVNCPCGPSNQNTTIRIYVKTCYNDVQSGRPCSTCKGQSVDTECSKYKKCETCGEGLDRCLTCPAGRYGQWCDKECDCDNDGSCDPASDLCICQPGFVGDKCQFAAVILDVDTKHRAMKRRRQTSDTAKCPMLPPPSNGDIHIEAAIPTVGDAIKYTCRENYTMLGSSTRHCLSSGKWAGEAPTCEKLCPYPVVDPYVKVQVNPNKVGAPLLTTLGNEVLAELTFSCDFGFVLVGASRVRCASGLWDQTIPTCAANPECPDPGVPDNGNREVRGPIKAHYKIGTQMFFTCLDDHILVGSSNVTCMPFSQWSHSRPMCVSNVITECTFQCHSTVAQVLDVAQTPLLCSLDKDMEKRVILVPEKEAP